MAIRLALRALFVAVQETMPMYLLFERQDATTLVDEVLSLAAEVAGLSEDGRAALRKWRDDLLVDDETIADITNDCNAAITAYFDGLFARRIKTPGRAETYQRR